VNIYIVIPAHNEQDTIGITLESLVNQSLKPKRIVVVNDNSTDNTQEIAESFEKDYSFIKVINNISSNNHIPGSKIVKAFNKGLEHLDNNYDIICKFDADLIFPKNYLETLVSHYKSDKRLGIVAGHCYIERNGKWELENLTNKNHIRGALKAYRKKCFFDIGQLKPTMGWDTIDELLTLYYNWKFKTDETLKVKHLKPTGVLYNKASKYLQGEAWYKMRFGIILTLIASIKLAFKKREIRFFKDYVFGYFKAKKENHPFIVTKEQGRFIRQLHWKNILKKISPF